METNNNSMEIGNRDTELWKIAKKRAGFKYQLLAYLIMNIFFWLVWYFNQGNRISYSENGTFPWPVWPMFFWGIGVFFNYLGAYRSTNRLAEREYEKLTHKQ